MLSIFKNIFSKSNTGKTIEKGALVIDVRSTGEFQSGHLAGAKNIPLEQLLHDLETLRNYPQLVVYCRSGNRSSHAKKILIEHGFKNVIDGGSLSEIQSLTNANDSENAGLVKESNYISHLPESSLKDPIKLKVLIPTDFSEQTDYAYIIANKLDEHFDLEYHFIHVIDAPDSITLSKDGLIETCGEIDFNFLNDQRISSETQLANLKLKYGQEVFTHLVFGKITDHIIHFAENNHFDLIALGTKGAWGIKEKISSSQAQIIARLSKVPILSVMCDRSDLEIQNLLFVHDFQKREEIVPPLFGRLVKNFNLEVHLLHVLTEYSTEDESVFKQWMNEYASQNGINKFVSHVIKADSVEGGVNKWLETTEADIVCIGTHGKGSFFHSSAAESIIKHLFKPIISFHLTQN